MIERACIKKEDPLMWNKMIIGDREKIEGVKNAVWVFLRDEKIGTQVSEEEMFESGMHRGCLIEHEFFDTREGARRFAWKVAKEIGAEFVAPEEFLRREALRQSERVGKAFAIAEGMIRLG